MTTSECRRYEAVRTRVADPSFVFAVRTTGIVCRCGCPSRTPAPQNVLFFEDVATAVRAGFRACKRCAPCDAAPDAERDRLVAKACALLDDPEGPSVAGVAASVGLSRFHFQRVFRATVGVTPAAYRRARRDRRFRERLAGLGTVTQALMDAGFGSVSRAYESQPLGMTPTAYKNGAAGERIVYAIATCALGRVVVAVATKGVCAIELSDDDASLVASLRANFPHADLVPDDVTLADDLAAVVAGIERPSHVVDLDLDVRGTAFQQRVWHALRAVKPGERVTYAELANAIGKPGAARAIGAACAANKLAVAIPCHRVTRSDGELSGYRWGVERKRSLLERERTER